MKRFFLLILVGMILITGCGSPNTSYQPKAVQKAKVKEEQNFIEPEKEKENKKGENKKTESKEESQTERIPVAYNDIIAHIYEFIIADHDTRSDNIDIMRGIWDVCSCCDTIEEELSSIGYLIYDVDHNGTSELMIIERKWWDNRILCMYTLEDNEAVLVIDGWSRTRYFLLEDDTIYFEGSGGAAYSYFETYHMAEDGKNLIVDDYYFSDFLNGTEDVESWSWFHNTTGEHDMEKSEIVDKEKAYKLEEEYNTRIKPLDAVYYSEYLNKK